MIRILPLIGLIGIITTRECRGLNLPKKDINRAIYFSKNVLNMMQSREEMLGYADVKITKGSPSHGQFVAFAPMPEALKQEKDALIATHATTLLLTEFCHNRTEDCVRSLNEYHLGLTPLHKICKRLHKSCTKEEILSKYRSIDGSCNNIGKPIQGKSFTVYGRMLLPRYLDGVKEPRRSVTKTPLPSPRLISTNVLKEKPGNEKINPMFTLWTQFVEHDLTHTAMRKSVHTGRALECCREDGGTNSPRYVHPYCFPIEIFFDDEYYNNKDVTCLSYARSIPGISSDCVFGPMEQLNQATHFLDASQIYGPVERVTYNLREFQNGRLASSQDGEMLPVSKHAEEDCQHWNETLCFQSGDSRVNLEPEMSAMYTLWVKEHNRIAATLAGLNPDWDDETLFQETRRIVIAEIQHITYDEWLPIVLGDKSTSYQGSSPDVSNEFATAAIRALELINYIEGFEVETRSGIQNPRNLGGILMKTVTDKSALKIFQYSGTLSDKRFGYDILTMDIQRSRDHGLPSYNDLRVKCGLPRAKIFEDFLDHITTKGMLKLKTLYKHPEDVDLIAGGLLEVPQRGVLGPTLSCILSDQFQRTRFSDRYFYTNKEQPSPFSDSQLKEIDKVTLARIICDNGHGVDSMLPKVFLLKSQKNPMVLCDELPRMDLSVWTTKREKYF